MMVYHALFHLHVGVPCCVFHLYLCTPVAVEPGVPGLPAAHHHAVLGGAPGHGVHEGGRRRSGEPQEEAASSAGVGGEGPHPQSHAGGYRRSPFFWTVSTFVWKQLLPSLCGNSYCRLCVKTVTSFFVWKLIEGWHWNYVSLLEIRRETLGPSGQPSDIFCIFTKIMKKITIRLFDNGSVSWSINNLLASHIPRRICLTADHDPISVWWRSFHFLYATHVATSKLWHGKKCDLSLVWRVVSVVTDLWEWRVAWLYGGCGCSPRWRCWTQRLCSRSSCRSSTKLRCLCE